MRVLKRNDRRILKSAPLILTSVLGMMGCKSQFQTVVNNGITTASESSTSPSPTPPSLTPPQPSPTPSPAPGPMTRPCTPAAGLHLVGAYTSSPDGSVWNYGTGTANDHALDQGIQQMEAAIGHTINAYNIFPVWGDENYWADNLGGTLAAMRADPIGSTMVPIVGIKFFWPNTAPQNYGWDDINGLIDVGNGKFDATWSGMVDQAKANGFMTIVWRLGYEDNFDFMGDSEGWGSASQAAWVKAFEHVSAVIRAESVKDGVTSYIMYNPSLGGGSEPVDTNLPALSSFDILGADQYNEYWGSGDVNVAANRVAYWATPGYWGMDQQIALAKKIGKPIYFAETGAGTNPNGAANGLANDTAFWDFMAASIQTIRTEGVPMLGMDIWNINAGDGNWQFTGGAQPACQADIAKYMADGTFVGDLLGATKCGN